MNRRYKILIGIALVSGLFALAFQVIISFNMLTIAPNALRTTVGQLIFRDLGSPGHSERFQAFNPLASNINWIWPPQDLFGCWQSDGAGNLFIGPCLNSAGVNVQTGTTYTFVNGDCGKLAVFSSSSAVAVTLPQAGVGGNFKNGCLLSYSNIGTGTVTITATTSTIDNVATPVTVAGNQTASPQGGWIFSNGSNYFTNRGMFRIGAITAGHLGLFDVAGTGYMADAGVVPPTGGSGGTGPFGCGSFFQEVPSGLLNGSNTVFNLTYKPSPVYAVLELDGVVQDPYVDYTLGADGTITYTVAPKSTDSHVAWYFRCELAGSSGGGGGSLGARLMNSSNASVRWTTISGTNITGDLSIGMWISIPTDGHGILVSRSNQGQPFQLSNGTPASGSNGHPGSIGYAHTYGGAAGNDHMFWNDAVPLATWTSPSYTSNGWHYVGITRDSAAKTVSLYVGDASSMTLIGTQSYTHTPDASTGTGFCAGNTCGVWLGDFPNGCGGCESNVAFQEHYIWSGKLTLAQHLQAARGNAISTNLQLKCLMGNNPEVDLSANGDSGTPVNTSLVTGH